MKKSFIFSLLIIMSASFIACSHNKTSHRLRQLNDSIVPFLQEESDAYKRCEGFENSVAGHDERDTIVGNFTGKSIDTIYIQVEETSNPESELEQYIYWAVCSNPQVHRVRLHGEDLDQPKLVFEGDLDGNGTDEWGYLHTWFCSQWRTYRIFTFYQNKWWYLTDDWNLLNTPEYFRASGLEVTEPGLRKGTIHIHYGTYLINGNFEIADTIIYPRFAELDAEDLSI